MNNRDLKYLNTACSNTKLKVKQYTNTEILFLDDVNLGENEHNVVKKLGKPFSIHRDSLAKLSHTVYTYGLKSGSNKLKVELHFVEDSFSFGTISYMTNFINYLELNTYLKEKYSFTDFNFLRDIIVDPLGNVLEFHVESNCFTIILSIKGQFKLWNSQI